MFPLSWGVELVVLSARGEQGSQAVQRNDTNTLVMNPLPALSQHRGFGWACKPAANSDSGEHVFPIRQHLHWQQDQTPWTASVLEAASPENRPGWSSPSAFSCQHSQSNCWPRRKGKSSLLVTLCYSPRQAFMWKEQGIALLTLVISLLEKMRMYTFSPSWHFSVSLLHWVFPLQVTK